MPEGRSTSTVWTPASRPISVETACTQWPHVMPDTWKVVVPTKLRGVVVITGCSSR
jgi:hypothetical protein